MKRVVGEPDGFYKDLLDQLLARLVLWMRLASVENLQATSLGGDLSQPLRIAEEKVGAFVGGRATGKAEGQYLGIKRLASSGHFLQQRLLGTSMSSNDFLSRHVDHIAQKQIVATPG